jgi:hypothetical protein
MIGYDANGNRTSVRFPRKAAGFTQTVTALSAFDYADREATLSYQEGTGIPVPLAASAAYRPFGPLAAFSAGNGATETHAFDSRYLPTQISVTRGQPLLTWNYATDDVGNITGITDMIGPDRNRTYGYQDQHYFLTQGDGPWGTQSWSYDRIGNRLDEIRDGAAATSTYVPNALGGNSGCLRGAPDPPQALRSAAAGRWDRDRVTAGSAGARADPLYTRRTDGRGLECRCRLMNHRARYAARPRGRATPQALQVPPSRRHGRWWRNHEASLPCRRRTPCGGVPCQ